MITHDELIFAIEQELGITHGTDFLVAHPIGEDGKQCGEAYLFRWKTTKVAQPNIEKMKALYYKEHCGNFAATRAREQRDFLIAATDWTQGADVPKAVKAKFSGHRQALRDVPDQPGFPHTIDWPVAPQ